MKRILTLSAIVAFFGLFLVPSGCVKEDFDTTPPLENIPTWTKTASIAQVKALYNATTGAGIVSRLAANTLGDSIIIEGTVISCDSASNFYETVTIAEMTETDTVGIDLKINASELYLTYGLKPGQKILVLVNDLILDNYNGVYQLGMASTDAGVLDLVGINSGDVDKYIQRSGSRTAVKSNKRKINQLTTGDVQTLITLDSVQFWNQHTTYSIPEVNTNRTLIDKNGNQIVLRTSGFAKFASDALPTGSGSITGVLSIYGSTYQLYIRDTNDIKFNDPTFGAEAPNPLHSITELKALCTSNIVAITQDFVIDAVVNANDESGNIYKSIFIEDETGGIEFKVDVSGLYVDFPIGTKIVINCNGLYVGKYGGVVQLGGLYNGSIGRLTSTTFYKKVFIVDSNVEVTATETAIADINDSMIGKIVTLPTVQFVETELGLAYAGTSTTNRTLQDINGAKIIVRTSNYADFATNHLPSGSGSITAVLSKYGTDYQLYIRDLSDVHLLKPRFEIQIPEANTTIAALKASFTTSPMLITDNAIIEGVIVGNDISGNLYKQLFIDDGTAGIEFKVNVTDLYQGYPVGTKVVVNCKGMYLGTYGGIIQLGGLYNGSFGRIEATEFNSKVFTDGTGTVSAVETTIPGITDAMIGKLVKLQNVQFIDSDLGKTYSASTATTNRTIENASGNTIVVRTSNYANFASTTLPSTSGTMYAILSKYNGTYQLYIREIGDVIFDQTRMP